MKNADFIKELGKFKACLPGLRYVVSNPDKDLKAVVESISYDWVLWLADEADVPTQNFLDLAKDVAALVGVTAGAPHPPAEPDSPALRKKLVAAYLQHTTTDRKHAVDVIANVIHLDSTHEDAVKALVRLHLSADIIEEALCKSK